MPPATPSAYLSPFASGIDAKCYFSNPLHEEALARVEFLVDNQRRLGLLFGPAGCGKSFLLEVFARRARRQGRHVAVMSLIGAEPRDFIWALVTQLGANPSPQADTFVLWQALQDRLREHRYQQIATVVLLDDADQARPETLTQVTRLLKIDPTPEARLAVLLTAHSRRLERIDSRLLDLSELHVQLEAWEETDTAGYLRTCLDRAELNPSMFTRAAAARVHALCRGLPRQVAQLANLALIAAAGQRKTHIEPDLVDEVFEELVVVEAPR